MVALPFNATGIDPEFGGYAQDPIWGDGWNKVIITDTRPQELDKQRGSMLVMAIRAVEGPDAGKTGTVFANVWHTDPATKARADQQIAALCFAMGIGGFTDTMQMHNLPFWIENKAGGTRKGNDGKEYPRNNFTSVRNLQGVEPGKPAGSGGAPQMQAPQPPAPPPAPPPGPAAAAGWGAPPPSGPAPSWGPPQSGAPAAPSSGQPSAPAAAPAGPGNWAPQPQPQPQQQPPAPQQYQQPPAPPNAAPAAPAPGNWAPQTSGAPAAPAWGPPR
jgi:hypothetical protein